MASGTNAHIGQANSAHTSLDRTSNKAQALEKCIAEGRVNDVADVGHLDQSR